MSGFQTRLLPTVNPHTRPPLLLQLDIVSISIWSTRSTQPNQVVSVQHHLETTSEAIGVENEDDDTPSCTRDRKSTRLNSSHGYISYAAFCLKKKSRRCSLPSRTGPQGRRTRPSRRRG